MISDDIKTLRTRFVSQWDADAYPVTYQNAKPKDFPVDALYARFSALAGGSKHIYGDTATGIIKQIGRVYLQIFIPRGQMDGAGLTAVDAFTAIFRNWRYHSADDAHQIDCETPQIDQYDDDPDWYQINVSIPWTSHTRY